MIRSFLWIPCALLGISLAIQSPVYTPSGNSFKDTVENTSPSGQLFDHYVSDIYQNADLQSSGLDSLVFKKAVTGYYNLKQANKLNAGSCVLTIVDLAKSSCTRRLWIVDLQKQKLVLNTWVAHGQNSGGDMASHFSNNVDSFQSSLGFYITNNVYIGKHGRSLRLEGMDQGFNDRAGERDIVLHAAPYVCSAAIRDMGRLGRSQGCPAVAPEVADRIIDTIKDKNVLFINGNDDKYHSKYLDRDMAARLAFVDNDTSEQKVL